jgi:pimeloyl-ACP methyl ester carboxylesterase
MLNINLTTAVTADNLLLHGLYSSGDKSKPAVILIHGFVSDFYTRKYKQDLMSALQFNNVGFVSIQTRGTGLVTQFTSPDGAHNEQIGSLFEKLEEAHLDISAWIERLQQEGYTKFILAGHSLGTIKAVCYLFEGKHAATIEKLVLLAPFDKNGYIEQTTKGEWRQHVQTATQVVVDGKGEDFIPPEFREVPMTYQTYLSWYQPSDLNSMWDFYRADYDFPILNQIKIPVKVIVGDADNALFAEEFTKDAQTVKEILLKHIQQCEVVLIPGANHIYTGQEQQVVAETIEFLS